MQRHAIFLAALLLSASINAQQSGGSDPEIDLFSRIRNATDQVISLTTKLDAVRPDAADAQAQQTAIRQQMAAQQALVETTAAKCKDCTKTQTAAANFWVMAGDSGKALAHADAAVKSAGKHLTNPRALADALTARALAEASAGDHDAARADAQKALRMYPDDDGALLIAQMADRDGRAIRQSVTVNGKRATPPDSVKGRSTGVSPGAPDAARSSAGSSSAGDASVAIDEDVGRVNWPRVAQSLLVQRKAVDALARGDYSAMHSFAAQAAALFPRNVNAVRAEAFASSMLGHAQDALSEVQGALRLKPDAPPLLALRARVYNQLARHDDALKDAARALAADEKLADAWLQKARARKALGDAPAQYAGDLARAVAADPSFDASLTPEERALLGGRGVNAGSSAPVSSDAAAPRGLEAWARSHLWALALFLGIDAGLFVWLVVLFARRRRKP